MREDRARDGLPAPPPAATGLAVAWSLLLLGVGAALVVPPAIAGLLARAPEGTARGFGAAFQQEAHGLALGMLVIQAILAGRHARRPPRILSAERAFPPSSVLWIEGILIAATAAGLVVELAALAAGSMPLARAAAWALAGLGTILFASPLVLLRRTAIAVWRHPLALGVLAVSAAATAMSILQALAYRHDATPFGGRDGFILASSWVLVLLVVLLAYFLGSWQRVDRAGVARSFSGFRFTFVLLVAVPITLSFFPISLPNESPLLDHPVWAIMNALSLGAGGILFRRMLLVRPRSHDAGDPAPPARRSSPPPPAPTREASARRTRPSPDPPASSGIPSGPHAPES